MEKNLEQDIDKLSGERLCINCDTDLNYQEGYCEWDEGDKELLQNEADYIGSYLKFWHCDKCGYRDYVEDSIMFPPTSPKYKKISKWIRWYHSIYKWYKYNLKRLYFYFSKLGKSKKECNRILDMYYSVLGPLNRL